MNQPQEHRATANGVGLCYFEWPGDGPTVFFAHATGFHARCWDQVVARLPGRHVIAIDMRGHGRSEKVPPPYKWMFFGEDVAALANQIGIRDALAVGHSKGGHAITVAGAMAPGIFASLLLVDPVIMPRASYAQVRTGEGHFAAKRRNEWASADEMFERFRNRPPFDLWDPLVLRDYCDFGVVPGPGGRGFVLACPPEVEAATYAGSAGADPYDHIAKLTIPVRILRARQRNVDTMMDMSSSPTSPDLVAHFTNATDYLYPELTHYMPMQAPGLVAEHILEMLA